MNIKKNAFTLAEVLITLGIIGIVASLTLPVLVQSHRKKTIETRLQKFYTNINQAIKMSELDNGDKKEWASLNCLKMGCYNWYNTYLGKYLVTTSVSELNQNNIMVYFADGSLVIIKNGYDFFFYPEAKNFNAKKFLQNNESGEQIREDAGKNFFGFQFTPQLNDATHREHYNKGVEPYKALNTRVEVDEDGNSTNVPNEITSRADLLNNTLYGCNKTSRYRAYCTALIEYDGWKISDDYPFRF